MFLRLLVVFIRVNDNQFLKQLMLPTKTVTGWPEIVRGAGITSMSLKGQAWYLIMPFLPTTLWLQKWQIRI